MAISKRLRYEVLRRDNHACRYCGAAAPDVTLTVDHVIPLALGGTDDPTNLVTACAGCNAGKSSSSPGQPLVDDVTADALRWGRAMSKAAEALMTARNRHQDLRDQFLARWNNWTYRDWRTGKQIAMELPGSWRTSIDRILDAGLPIEILCECVDTAMGTKGVKDEFRYMCGIAWNKVQALIEIASALNESAEDD